MGKKTICLGGFGVVELDKGGREDNRLDKDAQPGGRQ